MFVQAGVDAAGSNWVFEVDDGVAVPPTVAPIEDPPAFCDGRGYLAGELPPRSIDASPDTTRITTAATARVTRPTPSRPARIAPPTDSRYLEALRKPSFGVKTPDLREDRPIPEGGFE